MAPQTRILIFDVDTGRVIRRLPVGRTIRGSAHFSPDGRLLAAVDDQDQVYVWDVASGTQRQSFGSGQGTLRMRFSADENTIVTTCGFPGRGVWVWDTATGKRVATINALQRTSNEAVLSPDGTCVATWGFDAFAGSNTTDNSDYSGIVQLWDARTGKELRRLAAGSHVDAVQFAPDGKTLAILDRNDGTSRVHIFDPHSGRELRVIRIADESADQLIFTADGKTFAAVARRGPVRLWDVASGKSLLIGQTGPCDLTDAIFVGKRLLACGSSGGTIRL